MNTLLIGDYEITQESGRLIIDTRKAPKGSTFEVLALLSQLANKHAKHETTKKTSPKKSKENSPKLDDQKAGVKKKRTRIHRLGTDHPIILKALEMKAKGKKTKDICSKLGISNASYYRWTREAEKQQKVK